MAISPITLVAQALECPEDTLTPKSGLANHPNWDSLGHLNIMTSLEEHYGIEINDDTIRRFQSLSEIISFAENQE